jgi:hypothetical protein
MENSKVEQQRLKKLERDRLNREAHREQRREYAKKYDDEHRDEINARKKAHYEEHKDRYKEYNKNYSAEYQKRRWLCPVCKVTMSLGSKSQHEKSQVHADFQKPIPGREVTMGSGSRAFRARIELSDEQILELRQQGHTTIFWQSPSSENIT